MVTAGLEAGVLAGGRPRTGHPLGRGLQPDRELGYGSQGGSLHGRGQVRLSLLGGGREQRLQLAREVLLGMVVVQGHHGEEQRQDQDQAEQLRDAGIAGRPLLQTMDDGGDGQQQPEKIDGASQGDSPGSRQVGCQQRGKGQDGVPGGEPDFAETTTHAPPFRALGTDLRRDCDQSRHVYQCRRSHHRVTVATRLGPGMVRAYPQE